MSSILKKKRYERMLYSRPMAVFLIVLIFFLSRAVIGVYEKAQSTSENMEVAHEELITLQERGDLLEDKLSTLGTPKGVEAEIRDKFNVIKEGESVIMLIDSDVEEVGDSESTKRSFWQKIKGIF